MIALELLGFVAVDFLVATAAVKFIFYLLGW